jgi:hypothetical protein
MSAFDPKRTWAAQDCCCANSPLNPISLVANPCCISDGIFHPCPINGLRNFLSSGIRALDNFCSRFEPPCHRLSGQLGLIALLDVAPPRQRRCSGCTASANNRTRMHKMLTKPTDKVDFRKLLRDTLRGGFIESEHIPVPMGGPISPDDAGDGCVRPGMSGRTKLE